MTTSNARTEAKFKKLGQALKRLIGFTARRQARRKARRLLRQHLRGIHVDAGPTISMPLCKARGAAASLLTARDVDFIEHSRRLDHFVRDAVEPLNPTELRRAMVLARAEAIELVIKPAPPRHCSDAVLRELCARLGSVAAVARALELPLAEVRARVG